MKIKSLVYLAIVLFGASLVSSAIIEVGDGDNQAEIFIEWKDGFTAEFVVSFDTDSITGWDAFDVIIDETTLTTVVENFGWGDFIDGISVESTVFGDHSNIGFISGADWWHYWVKDVNGDWQAPAFGLSDRTLMPGDTDGWRYGSDYALGVTPEPATMMLLAVGGFLARIRKV
jgi:hypothetical protein